MELNINKKNLALRYKKQAKFELKIKLSVYILITILSLLMLLILSNGIKAFSGYYMELKLPTKLTLNNHQQLTTEIVNYNVKYEDQAEIIKTIIGYRRLPEALSNKKNNQITVKLTDNLPQIIDDNPETGKFIQQLIKSGKIKRKINFDVLRKNDSRFPENAGLNGSIIGSFMIVVISLLISLPIGVITGFYLEEYCNNKKFKSILIANINNMASIPSIIYGLMGLSIFVSIFHLPRSSSILAGVTMSLMVLPLIIICTRQALQAIPKYLRDSVTALGIDKSHLIIDHLLPLSVPGIMSGTIFTISRILGETAPLLMLGLVAFSANSPETITEPTTTLTVQIFLWSANIEKAYIEKTFAAIIILLITIALLNFVAFIIRKKYERKW